MKYKHQLLFFVCLIINFNFFHKLNSLNNFPSKSISDNQIDLNSQLKDIETVNSRLEKEISQELKSNETLETIIHNKFENNINDIIDILDEESDNTDDKDTGFIKFIERQRKMNKLNYIKRTNKTKIKKIHHNTDNNKDNNKDKRITNNNINSENNNDNNDNNSLIFEDNNDLDNNSIKNYIDNIIKNNKQEIKLKHTNDIENCELFNSIVYILKQKKHLLAKRILINKEKIILYNNNDKEESKIHIDLNLISSIKLIDDGDNKSLKEKCFEINYYPLDFKSSIEEIVLCNSSIYFSNSKSDTKNIQTLKDSLKNIRGISEISEEFDKNFLIKQILGHKYCKYSEQLITTTQPVSLDNKNIINNNINDNNNMVFDNLLSMKGEIEEINKKKKIQEKYISEISTLFEESDTEQKALKRDFIQKLNDIKIHNKEQEIKEREIIRQQENKNNDIDHEITEFTDELDPSINQVNNNNSEEIKQLESLIKEVKGKIISSKIEKIESMRKRFNSIIEQNEFEAKIKAKKFLSELNNESNLVVENKCGDFTVTKDIICSELFGLSGKEECLSDGYFCNRCCGFYIGSKFKKQLSECLVKCKSQREIKKF